MHLRNLRPPGRFELLFADPFEIASICVSPGRRPFDSPLARWLGIAPGEWDLHVAELSGRGKSVALRKRFVEGAAWEETGIYDIIRRAIARKGGVFDGCRTQADIVARYDRIDRLYAEVREEGRMRTPWEIEPQPKAQRNGIRVRMARDGRLLFAGRGHHRLAVGKALRLRHVPVALEIAHPNAVLSGRLGERRRERDRALSALGLDLPPDALRVPRLRMRALRRTIGFGHP